jgi:hypothetical protein
MKGKSLTVIAGLQAIVIRSTKAEQITNDRRTPINRRKMLFIKGSNAVVNPGFFDYNITPLCPKCSQFCQIMINRSLAVQVGRLDKSNSSPEMWFWYAPESTLLSG